MQRRFYQTTFQMLKERKIPHCINSPADWVCNNATGGEKSSGERCPSRCSGLGNSSCKIFAKMMHSEFLMNFLTHYHYLSKFTPQYIFAELRCPA